MNSVVSFLSSFVFTLHLVMNPGRLGGIVQVSFCFIFLCGRFVYNFQWGFSQSWGIWIEEGEEENKKGRCFSILKAGGGPPVREAAQILIFFSEGPTGWMVLVSSNVGCTEFLHVLPGGFMLWKIQSVHQIRRRLVQFLPHFPPCFLKSLRKEPFVFFSREVTLKFICVVLLDFICVIHRQL